VTARRLAPLALALVLGCGSGEGAPEALSAPTAPAAGAHARPEMVEALAADLASVRSPADGGGRAWLEGGGPAVASRPGSWTVVYEAGPLGVAVGGSVQLQVSPFWRWSTPQTVDPEAPGYTRVQTEAEGVELGAGTLDQQLLGIEIAGRALAPGERIRITYGAGPAGARADRFAERESRFWIAVDGDGDGVREWVPDSPTVDVAAGTPARLLLHLPGVARPGEEVTLTVAVLDAVGNAGVDFEGEVVFGEHAESVAMPGRVRLEPGQRGITRVPLRAGEEGIVRIRATGPGRLLAISNPMRVSAKAPRVRFGDLHGHSNLSDGTGTPEDYYAYARDLAALDFAALTDHDHWGIPFLDARPALRERIRRATETANTPGSFVALHGFEWTSWIYGHRHVLWFDGGGAWLSSFAEETDSPPELWAALRGQPAMTLAHHSAGGPIATDWTFPPDPELEPLTEVASVHGSSEAPDAPASIYAPAPGNFVRDALDLGYRLGFIGSGDSHDGHPGLAHIESGHGGIAAVFSEDLTRDGLRRALVDRLAYATNGPRILLDVRLNGHPMGRVIPAHELGIEARLVVDVIATAPLERIDLVRSGEILKSADGEDRSDVLLAYPVRELRAGEYLYVRVVQRDGGAAWSSPFFIE